MFRFAGRRSWWCFQHGYSSQVATQNPESKRQEKEMCDLIDRIKFTVDPFWKKKRDKDIWTVGISNKIRISVSPLLALGHSHKSQQSWNLSSVWWWAMVERARLVFWPSTLKTTFRRNMCPPLETISPWRFCAGTELFLIWSFLTPRVKKSTINWGLYLTQTQ